MSTIIFGEADPRDYMEPLCAGCHHAKSDHEGDEGLLPCWHGWEPDGRRGDGAGGDGDRGCECLNFIAPEERRP